MVRYPMQRVVLRIAMMLVFILAEPFSSVTAYANPNIYYVSLSGNDLHSGTQTQPFRTIQKAANIVNPGDTIYVMEGNYDERVIVNRSGAQGSHIILQAYPGHNVVTRGFTIGSQDSFPQSFIKIQGFEITDTIDHWRDKAGISINGSHIEILDNYIHHIRGDGIQFHGVGPHNNNLIKNNRLSFFRGIGVTIIGSNSIIENNDISRGTNILNGVASGDTDAIRFFGTGHVIRGNYLHDFRMSENNLEPLPHMDAFQTFDTSSNILIESNFVVDIEGQWAMLNGGFRGPVDNIVFLNNVFVRNKAYGLVLYDVPNAIIINNTFIDSFYGDIRFENNCSNSAVKNNIFYRTSRSYTDSPYFNAVGLSANNNLVYPITKSNQTSPQRLKPASDELNAQWDKDPCFVNPSSDDFRLGLASPAINVGTLNNAPATDKNGYARIGLPDIGAYECWDIVPPTISILSPLTNANIAGMVDITANASDNIGVEKVNLYLNNAFISSSASAISDNTYAFSIDSRSISNGIHQIKLVAYDLSGLTAEATATVSVNNQQDSGYTGGTGSGGGGGGSAQPEQQPTSLIVVNDGKAYTNDQRVSVKFTFAVKPIAMSFSNDVSNWSTPQPFSSATQWVLAPGDGKKTVYAKIQLTASSWSDPLSANIVLDSTPPKVTIGAAAPISASEIKINSEHKDVVAYVDEEHGLEKVEFYVNDKLASTDIAEPFIYRWDNSALPDGTYVFKVRAYDIAGNIGQATRYMSKGQASFKDIPNDYWALPYINQLNQRGIINGFADSSFRPAENITRAEFAKIIVLAMGWDVTDIKANSFADVPGDHWANRYVETAKSHGAISGYKDGTFKPSRNVTRAEIAKILAISKNLTTYLTKNLTDVSGSWAEDYILCCAEQGLISGYPDGRFRPQANATRAESSKMIACILH